MDIGQLLGSSGTYNSIATGINDIGQVVGQARTTDAKNHAFLYSSGVMTDLNDLIDPILGWTLADATAINDRGQIVGFGTNPSSETHAFLLTPTAVPTPSALISLLSLGMTVAGLGYWRKRTR